MSFEYPQQLDLDKLNVYRELDLSTQDLFNVDNLPNILTFGKHYFTLSFNESEKSNLSLKLSSQVLFEFKDFNGNVIFSDVTNYQSVNGSAVCFVFIREQRADGYFSEISNGIGSLTIVGELNNVPNEFKNVYNVRLSIPIEIRKDLPNISPIIFQDLNLLQASCSFSESIDLDLEDSNYKRSYINISASHLETFGGRVDKIELSYREIRARNNEFKVLSTYPLSSSIFEADLVETGGLNPVSDLQKFPMPREIRRNGGVEYKLRFINANGDYAQDISKNNVDVIITGSITNYTGSPVIIETTDNLVTGSGAFIFGDDVNNGIRLDFKPAGKGKFKEQETIEFTKVTNGADKKTIYTLSEKGGLISDIDTNEVSASDDSSIIGSVSSSISGSQFGGIIASSGSSLIGATNGVILGGVNNKISFPIEDKGKVNSIINGGACSITSSANNVNNSIIIGGVLNTMNTMGTGNIFGGVILGGRNHSMLDGFDSVIIGGFVNRISSSKSAIIGGTSNIITHDSSIILGMSNKTSDADDTVYVQNLRVDGQISASGDLINSQFVQMTNSSSAINTFNTGSFRSAKYVLQVTSASNYQVSEMLVLHNDGDTLNTEYAQINSGLNLVDFSTDVNGDESRLIASSSFISCSIKFDRILLPT